ncbi:MAG TPA: hypothetical protein VFS40_12815 [Gemmatimonadales bacterium]|nr:hypothetical protein [Gemmatimonadales bacterium]
MDLSPLHLHLMLNHLPLFGSVFILLVLLWAWVRRSREGMRLGLWLAVLLALATIPVYLTGEPAEDQLRAFDPSAPRRLMHEHEESGERGFIFVLVTGAVALVALWATRRREEHRTVPVAGPDARPDAVAVDAVVVEPSPAAQGRGAWPLVVMVCLIVAFYLFAYAALLGGQIRHPELRTPSSVVPPGATPAPAPATPNPS